MISFAVVFGSLSLEGYFRDSGFDQNTVWESGKR